MPVVRNWPDLTLGLGTLCLRDATVQLRRPRCRALRTAWHVAQSRIQTPLSVVITVCVLAS